MEQTTPKGATMLKVTGILMIIGGAISIIVSILAIIGIAAIAYRPTAAYLLACCMPAAHC